MPNTDEVMTLATIDQLTAGLACSDPESVKQARHSLATLAKDASPNLLLWLFQAIAARWEDEP